MPDGEQPHHCTAFSVVDGQHSATKYSMRTDDLDFHLPPELIAQAPSADRAASRLMHYQMADQSVAHRRFSDLPSLLKPGDLLVFNDARVIPARFMLQKNTGGKIEGLFLSEPGPGQWRALLKNLGSAEPGTTLRFSQAPEVTATVIEKGSEGEYRLAVEGGGAAETLLARIGRMPLPPYIKRGKDSDDRDPLDHERYQTVFAASPGSVAAPTAGLHFDESILNELARRGIEHTFITLHVGLGTFKPVTADSLELHAMHEEAYSIPQVAAEMLNRAKGDRRRIIAVGTTAARVLESQPADNSFVTKTDSTRIFIYPPYAWKHVDALITNFHLPRSTLIALVAARVGLAEQRRLYEIAITERYRFFSYGDAMFIE
jgi:S-adenosylmethionine:tRNA ribosyltransferase-isomerase